VRRLTSCTATTQTQNKTRQNYYASTPVYAGETYVNQTSLNSHLCCGFGHTHKV